MNDLRQRIEAALTELRTLATTADREALPGGADCDYPAGKSTGYHDAVDMLTAALDDDAPVPVKNDGKFEVRMYGQNSYGVHNRHTNARIDDFMGIGAYESACKLATQLNGAAQ